MSKFSTAERTLVKSIVASLSIKRIPEIEIMKEVFKQTNKTISRAGLYWIKQSIKKESYRWMMNLAKSEHEYLAEFKERVDEIIWLQRKHHELINKFANNPKIVQDSLEELHRLNLSLSKYFEFAPEIKDRQKMNSLAADRFSQAQELVKLRAEVDQLRRREKELPSGPGPGGQEE